MKDAFIQIRLESIHPHPDNRRVGGFDPKKLAELADSIKDVGVLEPVIVRTKIPGSSAEGYELVAGERRWRASKLAGLTEIPAIVRELDDLQVLKVQTIENLQREDVHPLDEADGYARLIDKAGYSVEQIAQELGKSASYVYQRLKLKDLVEPARKLLVDGKITAGHAILIARLPEPQQQELLKEALVKHDWQLGKRILSVHELDVYIQRELLMSLSKAPWKQDDADLVPEAGACSVCPKRTDFQPALFADVCNPKEKKSFCLDRSCFEAKADAALKRKELELSGAPLIRISERYGTPNAVSSYDATPCKKGTAGAVRTLRIDGPNQGQVGWTLPRGRSARQQAAKEDPKEAERLRKERAKKILDNKIARRTHRLIWERITAAAEKDLAKRKELPAAALRVAVMRMQGSEYHTGNLDAEVGKLSANATSEDLLLRIIQYLVSPALNPDWLSDYGLEDAKKLAAIYGVDLKAIEREAREELTKPKGPKLTNVSADGKKAAAAKAKKKAKRGVCSKCGCTDDHSCPGGCTWVNKEHTLCSSCADPEYVQMLGDPADG